MDLRTNEVVGSWRFSADTNEQVEYLYERDTQDPLLRLEEWAYSTLFANLRLKLQELLLELTGGTFVLENE